MGLYLTEEEEEVVIYSWTPDESENTLHEAFNLWPLLTAAVQTHTTLFRHRTRGWTSTCCGQEEERTVWAQQTAGRPSYFQEINQKRTQRGRHSLHCTKRKKKKKTGGTSGGRRWGFPLMMWTLKCLWEDEAEPRYPSTSGITISHQRDSDQVHHLSVLPLFFSHIYFCDCDKVVFVDFLWSVFKNQSYLSFTSFQFHLLQNRKWRQMMSRVEEAAAAGWGCSGEHNNADSEWRVFVSDQIK